MSSTYSSRNSKYSKYSRYAEPKSVKIVVVGPSGVGKTSIGNRFVKDEFNIKVTATLGAAFLEKTFEYVPGKILKMQIWDTAGQEKYRSIAKIYYQDAKIAILVYDVTSQASFEQMQLWAEQLRSVAPRDVIIAVVGNKMDLLGNTQDEMIDEMNYDIAKSYALSIGALFKVTSAKNSNGVNQLFTELAQQAAEKMELMSPTLSSKKVEIHEKQQGELKKKRCCS